MMHHRDRHRFGTVATLLSAALPLIACSGGMVAKSTEDGGAAAGGVSSVRSSQGGSPAGGAAAGMSGVPSDHCGAMLPVSTDCQGVELSFELVSSCRFRVAIPTDMTSAFDSSLLSVLYVREDGVAEELARIGMPEQCDLGGWNFASADHDEVLLCACTCEFARGTGLHFLYGCPGAFYY